MNTPVSCDNRSIAPHNRGVLLEAARQTLEDEDVQHGPVGPEALLGGFEVTQDYVETLGNECFIYHDLIIKQHIVTVIGMSGSGKTAFCYYNVAPKLAKDGLKVWYVDADSPASEHKMMKAFADKNGFKFLNPDVNEGTSTDLLITSLVKIADNHQGLNDYVFFFDTMKKFADLMSKTRVKDFFVLARRLTKLGATIVLLGHANKYRDKDGNLIFEGVADVRSDSDELIFLESRPSAAGDGINVTTVVDPTKGAKVRGVFKPISFNISTEREITFFREAIDLSPRLKQNVPEPNILDAAERYLNECKQPASQKQLVEAVRDLTKAGRDKVRQTISGQSVLKGTPGAEWSRFVYEVGDKNTWKYENRPRQKAQGEMFQDN